MVGDGRMCGLRGEMGRWELMKTTTTCNFTHSPGEREGNGITVLSDCEIHVRGKGVPLKHVDHGLESSCLQEVTTKDLVHFPLCG